MKQLINFDTSKGGNVPLYCLRNVRLGYGIGPKYENAITAWNNTEQHKDRNYPALDIPIYFRWNVDGHIGVRLKDGRFWSDGKIYPSVEYYEANYAPVYLGWGESVNNVKVIEKGIIVPKPTEQELISVAYVLKAPSIESLGKSKQQYLNSDVSLLRDDGRKYFNKKTVPSNCNHIPAGQLFVEKK